MFIECECIRIAKEIMIINEANEGSRDHVDPPYGGFQYYSLFVGVRAV